MPPVPPFRKVLTSPPARLSALKCPCTSLPREGRSKMACDRWFFERQRPSERHIENGWRLLLKRPVKEKHFNYDRTLDAQDCQEPAVSRAESKCQPCDENTEGIELPCGGQEHQHEQQERNFDCDGHSLPRIGEDSRWQVRDFSDGATKDRLRAIDIAVEEEQAHANVVQIDQDGEDPHGPIVHVRVKPRSSQRRPEHVTVNTGRRRS